MKRIILTLSILLVLASLGMAQSSVKVAAYVDNDTLLNFAVKKATAQACTSDIIVWGWAGTISFQAYNKGLNTGNKDTVYVTWKIQQANWQDPLAMKCPTDSLPGVDTLYSQQYGKIWDISTKVDGTYCGRLIATFSGPDSVRGFKTRKCLTPAK